MLPLLALLLSLLELGARQLFSVASTSLREAGQSENVRPCVKHRSCHNVHNDKGTSNTLSP